MHFPLLRMKAWMVTLCLLVFPALAMSQIEGGFKNTAPPSPVGSGARAMGTGGAFIAIADDATAANWNPGGLVQLLYPEVSLVFANEVRDVEGNLSYYDSINYLSAAYPFSVGEVNIVTSLNLQRLYDFTFKSDFEDEVIDSWTVGTVIDSSIMGVSADHYDAYNRLAKGKTNIAGEVGAVSPAVAIQIVPQFSVGVAFNFWKDGLIGSKYENEHNELIKNSYVHINESWTDDDFSCTCNGGPCNDGDIVDDWRCLDTNYMDITSTTYDRETIYKSREKISFEGQNLNVGFLWDVTPRFTIGWVYRSEFEMDMDRSFTYERVKTEYSPSPGVTITPPTTHTYDEMMRFPASYGVGLAFRFSDSFSIAADVSRIEWDRFIRELDGGTEISPINGLKEDDADIDPTISYRLGMEYLIIQPRYVVPIRWGFFYDPEPARQEPDDYYGVAVGTGLAYDKMVLDLAYWYRWGNDVILYTDIDKDPETGDEYIIETKGDRSQQMLMLSAILHF